jgi:hypothetical protein
VLEKEKVALESDKAFAVICDAGLSGALAVGTNELAVTASMQLRRGSPHEMWEALTITSAIEQDGSVVLRILIFHPDWEQALQVAKLRCRPQDEGSNPPTLEYDLEHIAVK